jgi:hypothetical protein
MHNAFYSHFPRYSLRSLLIAIGLFGAPGSWYAAKFAGARNESAVIRSLEGRAAIDKTQYVGPRVFERLLLDRWAFARVVGMSIYSMPEEDDIELIGGLRHLTHVTVDAGEQIPVSLFVNLPSLSTLEVHGAKISADHIRALRLDGDADLYLESCNLSADAVELLAARDELNRLSLFDSVFPPQSARNLGQSRSLNHLDVRECYLPDAVLDDICSLRPKLFVSR